MGRLNLILLLIAVFFFYGMLKQVGWGSLEQYFHQVGYPGILLLVPYGIMNLLTAVAWRLLLVDSVVAVPVVRLFWLRLAGESLNQLTPTASLGGEPFKAIRLKDSGVPWQQATASLIIHKGLMVMSLALYIILSLALVPFVMPAGGVRLGLLLSCTLLLSGAGVAFVVLQHRNPCVQVIRMLERWGKCPAVLKAKEAELASLDAAMAGFYRQYPRKGALAFLLLFLNWLLQGGEVYLIFHLLGQPVTWQLALCLDALAMIFTALGFMIPVQLGVQDGGNVLLALGFRLGAAAGLAFSIMRRVREAFWLLVGLVVITWKR
ncbi:lysylphosphatidylglycerol synthase transmembrane domain-containing protein [Geotalea sp. SG265]|uniref:lysylphosphatidylglycerol synthase transmembrane domain-containing protein n=1 Tax=Geotalea sp. SG265 TaxID=2922867 RepID=UPI001FAE8C8A|nr:lysylphosphatidylglycerol synthase transmembrane domain-containing protein [Geotalea sp. SG265]